VEFDGEVARRYTRKLDHVAQGGCRVQMGVDGVDEVAQRVPVEHARVVSPARASQAVHRHPSENADVTVCVCVCEESSSTIIVKNDSLTTPS